MDNPLDKSQPDYIELQRQVDAVIGKIGLRNTIFLLTSFMDTARVPIHKPHRFRVIGQYLILTAIQLFELEDKLFFSSGIEEYRQARMACFHLLRKYTGTSHAKMAKDFGLTKRNVVYNCAKCEERLSVPYYYTTFVEKYEALEKSLIHFISKLTDIKP